MGLFQKLFKKRAKDPSDDFWYKAFEELRLHAGEIVTATTAQRAAAVYACQTAISESVAMLPVGVFAELDERTLNKRKDHPLYKLLHDQPNPFQDSFEWRESAQLSALHHGDAFCQIRRSKTKKITEISPPLDPTRMKVKVTNSEREPLAYIYKDPVGRDRTFTQSEMFHFKPFSLDGIRGRTPIKVCSDVIGFQLAVQTHGNALFENGTFASGFIETPTAFETDEQRKAFMDSFKAILGARRSGKLGLLEAGVKFNQMSMNNRDAQMVELMNFGAVQIAMIYRMPPIMIQLMEKGMAFASVEQLSIMFTQYTIQPWGTRWEQAFKRQLLAGEDEVSVKFNVNALLRGDYKARIEAIIQQLQYGLLTINEARALEERNPIEDEVGDTALISHNLRPVDQVGELQEPQSNSSTSENPPSNEEPKQEVKEKSGRLARFEPLFTDLIGRLVRKEQKAVRNAMKKPGWLKWAEDFLVEHRDLMEETLEPAIKAHGDGGLQALYAFVDEFVNARQDRFLSAKEPGDIIDDTAIWTDKLMRKLGEVERWN